MSVADERYEDLDFETLESAVRQSPKGNWFLEEYARRLRSGETTSILDAISKLERIITSQTQVLEAPRAAAPVQARQLRYFKKDEELFEEARPVPVAKAVEPPPEAVAVAKAKPQAAAEQRGARLRIMRMEQPAVIDPFGPQAVQRANKPPEDAAAAAAPAAAPAPQPAAAAAPPAEKQRIIISRHAAIEDLAIPLVDDSATLNAG